MKKILVKFNFIFREKLDRFSMERKNKMWFQLLLHAPSFLSLVSAEFDTILLALALKKTLRAQ